MGQETKERVPVSTLKKDQVEEIVRGMDWTAIHRARVFVGDEDNRLVLFTDGDFSVMDDDEFCDPDASGVIGSLSCWGQENVDKTDYFEGWVEKAEDSEHVRYEEDDDTYRLKATGEEVAPGAYVESHTGRVLTEDEALAEAIRDRDWEGYEYEIEEVMRRYDEYALAGDSTRDAGECRDCGWNPVWDCDPCVQAREGSPPY